MDYMAKINELTAVKAGLITRAEGMINDGKYGKELTDLQAQIKDTAAQIQTVTDLAAESQKKAITPNPQDDKSFHVFNSLGEQLQAIARFSKDGIKDERLDRVNNAVQGAGSSTGADGGFAIQEDFAGTILQSAATTGEILSRVNSYTVGANSNSAKWLKIDETSVASTVYGGVQMYWSAEGESVGGTRPKMKEMRLELEKMMGLAYATSELLADAPFMTSFFGRCFVLASNRMLEGGIISGDGQGKPLGILNSPALITVSKSGSQTADTVNAENILKMWGRLRTDHRAGAVWLAHPDVEEQLQQLTMATNNLIWMPEGGLTAKPYQTLLGRPVVYTDQMSALGDAGDIGVFDLSQYMLLKKSSAKQDWSMHVEFLTDQMAFRIVLRVNGSPMIDAPLTIKNSSNTRSPFVTLAARA